MRFIYFFWMLLLNFFNSLNCFAQDSMYVFIDSTSVKLEKQNLKTTSAKTLFDNNANDFILKNKQLTIVNDSAKAVQNMEGFAYAKNLDSFLRILKNSTTKQVEIKVSTGPSWLEKFFFSYFAKLFFWCAGILFILFILYKLFVAEDFYEPEALSKKVNILIEDNNNLSTTTDYDTLIIQALNKKDYRMAVRFHYLQLLQTLVAKGAIQFAADKTNQQYITELYTKSYKDAFILLTITYEYAWYGGFEINETHYTLIKNRFADFNNQLLN